MTSTIVLTPATYAIAAIIHYAPLDATILGLVPTPDFHKNRLQTTTVRKNMPCFAHRPLANKPIGELGTELSQKEYAML